TTMSQVISASPMNSVSGSPVHHRERMSASTPASTYSGWYPCLPGMDQPRTSPLTLPSSHLTNRRRFAFVMEQSHGERRYPSKPKTSSPPGQLSTAFLSLQDAIKKIPPASPW